jgi:nucleoid-associated protein YgaU
MTKELVAALQSGGTPASFKKVLTNMDEKMTTLSAASDSKVAGAMKEVGVQAAEAAKAADPAEAADNPAFEKAGANLTAACKSAGVTVNF